jgi:hypothetical protein
LTNLDNEELFIPDVFKSMKELLKHNKPYIKASAVIAPKQKQKLFIKSMAYLADRGFAICQDIKEAKKWLSEQ